VGDVTGKMPEPAATIHFHADRGDARLRLDQILVRRVLDISRMSRSAAQHWIEAGAVSVDGQVVRRVAAHVREGAIIALTPPATATRRTVPQPEPGELRMLYEDGSFVAIDKPPGVVVHPTYKQLSGTLLNALLWHLRDRVDARPGILTRLDRGTSGIVIAALTAAVHAAMQRDAAAGAVRKEYLAIVAAHPRPRAGTITAPLARDPQDRRRVIVAPGGAPSETGYEVLAEDGDLALVCCHLVTGRTHQIRVHLASRGWPILGDATYGSPDARMTRPALHAWRITLPHPGTRQSLTIVAAVPADMRAVADAAGLQIPV
jgi:23S rRNA pseudouridine1911/1915/1917 synthase